MNHSIVYKVHTIKPIDVIAIKKVVEETKLIFCKVGNYDFLLKQDGLEMGRIVDYIESKKGGHNDG